MTRKIKAVFDGETLRPEEPLELAANTRVRLTIETSSPAKASMSFLRTARSLKLDGPADWSRRKLARECAKLDATVEKAIAEEGLSEDVSEWPEY